MYYYFLIILIMLIKLCCGLISLLVLRKLLKVPWKRPKWRFPEEAESSVNRGKSNTWKLKESLILAKVWRDSGFHRREYLLKCVSWKFLAEGTDILPDLCLFLFQPNYYIKKYLEYFNDFIIIILFLYLPPRIFPIRTNRPVGWRPQLVFRISCSSAPNEPRQTFYSSLILTGKKCLSINLMRFSSIVLKNTYF